MKEVHRGKYPAVYGVVQLFSILPEASTSETDYPLPITGEELVIFAKGGIQVSAQNNEEVEIFVYSGTITPLGKWSFIQSGAIQVIGQDFIRVGNLFERMTEVPFSLGTYQVSVYTDTGVADTTCKVAFVLEKIS